MRGWSLSEHNGKVRLRLQFPNEENWPANAQTNLPYAWKPSAETFTAVQGLVTRIYKPVNACCAAEKVDATTLSHPWISSEQGSADSHEDHRFRHFLNHSHPTLEDEILDCHTAVTASDRNVSIFLARFP
jgi:hypothetical protein